MKKRKTYEISVIDKTYSKIISDETKFYTSDTALELGFELKEMGYSFESAEIVLLNIDDRSLVTRAVSKVEDGFAYELDDDIVAHYGEWRGQVRFEQKGEIYVSSPVKFRIENDLSNERPPQLSDVQSWVSLKRYADKLTEELKQAVLSIEGVEDTFNENETVRQTTFETNESERSATFNTNESTRKSQELEREKAESKRQTTFETNESERQSAELIRVENENQRNLTSVDEFIKLQDSIGGRNYLLKSSEPNAIIFGSNNPSALPLISGVENGIDYLQSGLEDKFSLSTYVTGTYVTGSGIKYSEDLSKYKYPLTISMDVMAGVPLNVKFFWLQYC